MTALKLMVLACLMSMVFLSSQSEGFSFSLKCEAPTLMAKVQSLERKVDKLLTMVDKCKGRCGLTRCPRGWSLFQGSCYKTMTSYKQWQDARKYCKSFGGDLAVIKSAKENSFVTNLAKKQSLTNLFWFGLQRHANSKFYRVDGSLLKGQYSNWAPGEPNDGSEKCGMFYRNGKWNDYSCSNKLHAMCEISAAQ